MGLVRYAIQGFLMATVLNPRRLVLLLMAVRFKGQARLVVQARVREGAWRPRRRARSDLWAINGRDVALRQPWRGPTSS